VSTRLVHRISAACLDYPTPGLRADLGKYRQALGLVPVGPLRNGLDSFLGWLESVPLREAELHYVEVFDLSRKHALYLSYWTDGDTRRRGEVLAGFKQRYRESGWLVDTHGELPDYLPMVLEFSALADPVAGPRLLQDFRPSLELLRLALEECGSPYRHLLSTVCGTLPGASPADRAAVHAIARAGPPSESVGLADGDPRLLPFTAVAGGGR